LIALMLAFAVAPDDSPPLLAKFGTTVVVPSGLRGLVYHTHRWIARLPDFEKMRPVGTIYTASLNIPPQDFHQGFPGVTKRYEWFAIDYTGRFWIQDPGVYEFSLTSDDGSRLYIDEREIIDNDGQHEPVTRLARINLAGGIHRMRVSYFQGPRWQVALVLEVAGPQDEKLRVFNTDEFKPPPHPEDWKFGSADQLDPR